MLPLLRFLPLWLQHLQLLVWWLLLLQLQCLLFQLQPPVLPQLLCAATASAGPSLMLFCVGGMIGVRNAMQCSMRIRNMWLIATATADLALLSIHWKKMVMFVHVDFLLSTIVLWLVQAKKIYLCAC